MFQMHQSSKKYRRKSFPAARLIGGLLLAALLCVVVFSWRHFHSKLKYRHFDGRSHNKNHHHHHKVPHNADAVEYRRVSRGADGAPHISKPFMHAAFDPEAASHEDGAEAEDFGYSDHDWEADESWHQGVNFTERLIKLVPQLDINRDSYVDLRELEAWHLKNNEAMAMKRTARAMETHDANHDGFIDASEWLSDLDHHDLWFEEQEERDEFLDHRADNQHARHVWSDYESAEVHPDELHHATHTVPVHHPAATEDPHNQHSRHMIGRAAHVSVDPPHIDRRPDPHQKHHQKRHHSLLHDDMMMFDDTEAPLPPAAGHHHRHLLSQDEAATTDMDLTGTASRNLLMQTDLGGWKQGMHTDGSRPRNTGRAHDQPRDGEQHESFLSDRNRPHHNPRQHGAHTSGHFDKEHHWVGHDAEATIIKNRQEATVGFYDENHHWHAAPPGQEPVVHADTTHTPQGYFRDDVFAAYMEGDTEQPESVYLGKRNHWIFIDPITQPGDHYSEAHRAFGHFSSKSGTWVPSLDPALGWYDADGVWHVPTTKPRRPVNGWFDSQHNFHKFTEGDEHHGGERLHYSTEHGEFGEYDHTGVWRTAKLGERIHGKPNLPKVDEHGEWYDTNNVKHTERAEEGNEGYLHYSAKHGEFGGYDSDRVWHSAMIQSEDQPYDEGWFDKTGRLHRKPKEGWYDVNDEWHEFEQGDTQPASMSEPGKKPARYSHRWKEFGDYDEHNVWHSAKLQGADQHNADGWYDKDDNFHPYGEGEIEHPELGWYSKEDQWFPFSEGDHARDEYGAIHTYSAHHKKFGTWEHGTFVPAVEKGPFHGWYDSSHRFHRYSDSTGTAKDANPHHQHNTGREARMNEHHDRLVEYEEQHLEQVARDRSEQAAYRQWEKNRREKGAHSAELKDGDLGHFDEHDKWVPGRKHDAHYEGKALHEDHHGHFDKDHHWEEGTDAYDQDHVEFGFYGPGHQWVFSDEVASSHVEDSIVHDIERIEYGYYDTKHGWVSVPPEELPNVENEFPIHERVEHGNYDKLGHWMTAGHHGHEHSEVHEHYQENGHYNSAGAWIIEQPVESGEEFIPQVFYNEDHKEYGYYNENGHWVSHAHVAATDEAMKLRETHPHIFFNEDHGEYGHYSTSGHWISHTHMGHVSHEAASHGGHNQHDHDGHHEHDHYDDHHDHDYHHDDHHHDHHEDHHDDHHEHGHHYDDHHDQHIEHDHHYDHHDHHHDDHYNDHHLHDDHHHDHHYNDHHLHDDHHHDDHHYDHHHHLDDQHHHDVHHEGPDVMHITRLARAERSDRMVNDHFHRHRLRNGQFHGLEGSLYMDHQVLQFVAADVNHDNKLNFMELKDIMNPHGTKNVNLKRAIINATLATEIQDPVLRHKSGVDFVTFFESLYYLFGSDHPYSNREVAHETEAEELAEARKHFGELDTSQTGFLTLDNLVPIFEKIYPREEYMAHSSALSQLREADDNHDQRLSLEEMIKHWDVFYGELHRHPEDDHEEFRRL